MFANTRTRTRCSDSKQVPSKRHSVPWHRHTACPAVIEARGHVVASSRTAALRNFLHHAPSFVLARHGDEDIMSTRLVPPLTALAFISANSSCHHTSELRALEACACEKKPIDFIRWIPAGTPHLAELEQDLALATPTPCMNA